jgi:predicted site-specific integrase-resolvase
VAKPVRVITQKEWLGRLQVSLPTLLEYERRGLLPQARTICGRTMYIESECDEAILSAPVRPLRDDDD